MDHVGEHFLGTMRRWAYFSGLWLSIFLILFFLLYRTGLLPTGAQEVGEFLFHQWSDTPPFAARQGVSGSGTAEGDTGTLLPQIPTRIVIPIIGIDAPIVTAENRSFDTLNTALRRGVVHYPGSAGPGEQGNMFLFGHSSALPIVHNKAYTAFNRLSELKIGEIIRIQSGKQEYWYRVRAVAVRQADDSSIDLGAEQRVLTLSTCNVIGAKEDRFVVEAEFMKSYPLRSAATREHSAVDTSS